MNQHSNIAPSLTYQHLQLDRLLTQDISEDISLPDYQPEIKRLLRVTATVQPPTRYIGGGSIEFSGNVDFSILYAGEDNALYCFPASGEYTIRTAADGEAAQAYLSDQALCAYATIEPDLVSGRVGGPRKLSVRCRMRARVRAWGSTCAEEAWKSSTSGEAQRLFREQQGIRTLCGTSRPVALRDEILPDRLSTDSTRIVTAEATVLPEEITTATDRVSCRGQLCLKLLLQEDDPQGAEGGDSLPITLWRKIPYQAEIPLPGLRGDGEAVVSGSCTELNLILEHGKIQCEAELLLEARAQQGEAIRYTADLCCIGQHSQIEHTDLPVCLPLRCLNTNLSLNETLPAKDTGLPGSARLMDAYASVLPDSIKLNVEGKACILTGSCRYSLVYCADGEIAAREHDLPFRCSLDLGRPLQSDRAEPAAEYTVSVVSTKARLDERDGRLNLDAELAIGLRAWELESISPVSAVTPGAPCTGAAGVRRIYYPLPGETLWDVAKRDCCSVEQLCSVNSCPTAPRADHPQSLGNAHIVIV